MYCLHGQAKGNLILRGNTRLAMRRELGGRKSMKTKAHMCPRAVRRKYALEFFVVLLHLPDGNTSLSLKQNRI